MANVMFSAKEEFGGFLYSLGGYYNLTFLVIYTQLRVSK